MRSLAAFLLITLRLMAGRESILADSVSGMMGWGFEWMRWSAFMEAYKLSRFASYSFLESSNLYFFWISAESEMSHQAAPYTMGPRTGPRPASSMPNS